MICDDLKNIDKYSVLIPDSVIKFLHNIDNNLPLGKYEIDSGCYANVDEYFTKSHNCCRLEAHKKYIDIQILLDGVERLDYITTDGLSVSEEYDENRDVMFFENPMNILDSVVLKPNKFILLYPYEAHMPQMNASSESQKVKKIVVKIQV